MDRVGLAGGAEFVEQGEGGGVYKADFVCLGDRG